MRFRFLWFDVTPKSYLSNFYRHDLLRLFSNSLRSADFRTFHYDGRAGGSRTPRYGFPLFKGFGIGAGDRFDPQECGLGLVW